MSSFNKNNLNIFFRHFLLFLLVGLVRWFLKNVIKERKNANYIFTYFIQPLSNYSIKNTYFQCWTTPLSESIFFIVVPSFVRSICSFTLTHPSVGLYRSWWNIFNILKFMYVLKPLDCVCSTYIYMASI